MTVRKALDAAVPKIAATFAGRPRAEAKTRGAVGIGVVGVSHIAGKMSRANASRSSELTRPACASSRCSSSTRSA